MKNRRTFLTSVAQGTSAAAASSILISQLGAQEQSESRPAGKIRHSVCKWCYPKLSLDELCVAGKQFGLQSVELLQPEEVPTVQKHGLTCAIASGPSVRAEDGKRVGGITAAWNRPQYHDILTEAYRSHIEKVAALGLDNLICFSGNRDGMDDQEGLENCVRGLKRLMPIAEAAGVTITMELLNSRVDHPDYMCDRTHWGVALCELIDSERFKLLYDIYHMQIMEGDIIRTLTKHHRWISHYHTGGVPGRNEIDETQELFYPAIMRAIADTGYTGFVGQEFIPKSDDAIASLRRAIELCTV
jgi:hydroxypyruvate isomerase